MYLNTLLQAGYSFSIEKAEIWNYILKIERVISRTTAPMLGVFCTHFNAFFMVNPNLAMEI